MTILKYSGAANQMDSKDKDFMVQHGAVLAALGLTANTILAIASTRKSSFVRGNVYFCYTVMVDILITIVVVPFAIITMFEDLPTCHMLQFITEACNYTYSLFFLLLSLGDYYDLCRGENIYTCARIVTLTTSVVTVSFVIAGIGTHFELDYDYCERNHFGNYYFRIVTNYFFYVIPGIGTVLFLSLSCTSVWSWDGGFNLNREGRCLYARDCKTTCLNMLLYVLFVVFWTPYLIVVNFFPDANYYYYSVWFGVGRSLSSSLVYLCMDNFCTISMLRDICGCYGHIFPRATPNVVILRDRPPAVVNTAMVEMNPVGPEPEGQEMQETRF